MARNVKNDEFSEEHTESMRVLGKFQEFAGKTNPREDTAMPPDSEQPLLLSQTISASGGCRAVVSRSDWLALIRVWKLTPRRFPRS